MTPPIHILHIVDNLGKGGLENGVVNVITRLDPGRFRHTVCAIRRLGANADRLPRDRVQVLCLDQEGKGSLTQLTAFLRVIGKVRPHVVHSRNWPAIESVFAARLLRFPAVIHSEHGLDWAARLREPWRRARIRRLALELSDQVFCVSSELRALHAERTGFPADRISVIHNGVDTERYSPKRSAGMKLRAQLGIAAEEFCIGCVGNLMPVKGHRSLFQALEVFERTAFANEVPKWRLLMIGDGPERPGLEELVRSRGWSNRVSFLGLRDDIPELLNAFDSYVLPSLSEGMCNSLLEAMAIGLPVLATATGGNPEVIVDGKSGHLCPPADAPGLADRLLGLYHHPDVRQQFGKQARERVEQEFSISAMVRQYARTYSAAAATLASRKNTAVVTNSELPLPTEELKQK